MIPFSIYIKIFGLWFSFYFYLLIQTISAGYGKDRKYEYLITIACVYFSYLSVFVYFELFYLLDLYLTPFFVETPNLSLLETTIDTIDTTIIDAQKQNELDKIKTTRVLRCTHLLFLTTLIVWIVVFKTK